MVGWAWPGNVGGWMNRCEGLWVGGWVDVLSGWLNAVVGGCVIKLIFVNKEKLL